MIGLIGAMPMEVEPLIQRMTDRRMEQDGPHRFYAGSLAGVEVAVLCCGISKVNAAMGAQALVSKYRPELVLHVGVGGALVKGLDVGDVVVAGDCVQYDVDTTALGDPLGFVSTVRKITFPCDRDAVHGILAAADRMRRKGRRVIEGRVATGDRFLTRAEEKQEIVREFGAFLCDQESCAIAQVCHVHGTPCAVIRAVSDASDGQHASEYENHAPLAAKNAAELAWKYLEIYAGKS